MYKIAYQGAEGSYSHQTALLNFGEENIFLGVDTFNEVFELIVNNKADYAVLPIENSLIGSIYENYDLINKVNVQIIKESYTKIDHCLLAPNNEAIDEEEHIKSITKVFSHPKALEQCATFFKDHPWMEAIAYVDTAKAASDIAKKNNSKCGVIASANNKELYNLRILKKNIQDNEHNFTRFVIITKKTVNNADVDKSSISFTLDHKPSSLVNVLNLFSDNNLNLTKIESRPIHGYPFEYTFYIEVSFPSELFNKFKDILHNLKNKVRTLTVLGFYKEAILP
jgi:prephenate dehydratase